MSGQVRKFDLNMQEVLESWAVADAIREVIANALDEQALTGTDEIEISVDDEGRWHIRDYGRGLHHEHLTQNEDQEKLNNPDVVIGKFGVGLKDALATFHRNGVGVTIHSSHETIRVEEAPKADFDDVETLHGIVAAPEVDLTGTDVVLDGVSYHQVQEAKRNFLRFTDLERLEETRFGEVYATPEGEEAMIFVTGLRVATEENFLFSYNITRTTKRVREAQNRERSNVGRTAYTRRVKDILQECESTAVAQRLVDDFENFAHGSTHDEVDWKPIRLHAIKLLHAREDVVFATLTERHERAPLLEQVEGDGYRVVTVPENLRDELDDEYDVRGEPLRDLDGYLEEYNESFEYRWVTEEEMTEAERAVWERRYDILSLISHAPVDEIRVSETIRLTDGGERAKATWEDDRNRIVIHRSQLDSMRSLASTLLHQVAHPRSGGHPDRSQPFEDELTTLLGEVAESAIGVR